MLGAAVAGSVSLFALLAFLVVRRRRAMEEIDLLTSWDAFRAPSQPTADKDAPQLEDNIMDGTEEVQAELDLDP
jgi:hypothetical protein